MVDMMNEAHNVYEAATRQQSMADVAPEYEFTIKQFDKEQPQVHVQDLVKPEYLYTQQKEVYNDLAPSNLKMKMAAHSEACCCVLYNPIGDVIATGGADKVVKIWQQKKMVEITQLKNKSHSVCTMAFSQDNEYLMTCSTDNKA